MAASLLKLPLFFSVLFVITSSTLNAQNKTAYDQLVSVNKEWLNQPDIDQSLKTMPAKALNEQGLIRFHLQQTEQLLRKRSTTLLSPDQQKSREANLNTLHRYYQIGVFPFNDQHEGRQPYFIDKFNTYCAVGYLMQRSGADEIAKEIKRTQNFSYLADITEPRLMNWVRHSGLSLDELALIQPSYDGDMPSALTEIHYNNVGTDVNEYIEVHQNNAMVPNANFASILFYDALGTLYKTLPIASMQSFPGFYYYNFPSNESLADNGRIEMIGSIGNLLFVFNYNGSGITIEDHNPLTGVTTTTSYNVNEDDNTPTGNSVTFCGRYGTPGWIPTIIPATPGLLNPCVVMPISLLSFTSTTNGKTVQLKWQTASESNTDHFVAERSTDGTHFDPIGTVQAAGNSNTTKSYTFIDNQPNYINHYRLKLVNLDGSASYSRILYVKVADANPMSLSSNLVNDFLEVKINSTSNIGGSLLIYDFSGKKLAQVVAKTGSQLLNTSTYPAGKYLVRLVTNDGNAYSQVFVKQ